MAGVPTTVVLGSLGVGKTTFIRRLLAARPAGARWAVLVNELGEVGIDGALLGAGDVAVEEVAGGCLCCTASMSLRVALTRLLRRVRPERLLVEPTGLGHPAGVVDTLRDPWLARALELRATIALVDPRELTPRRLAESASFRARAQLADVLVAAKKDVAGAEDLARFRAWAAELEPPKLAVSEGGADPAWLDLRPAGAGPLFREIPHLEPLPAEPGCPVTAPAAGRPLRLAGGAEGHRALGWVYAPEACFRRGPLERLLAGLGPEVRVKGLVRTEREWLLVNGFGQALSVEPTAHRRDSRLTVIAPEPGPDPEALEAALAACLVAPEATPAG